MSNKFTLHLQVLPEDDANRQFINGLELNPRVRARQLQVLPPAGGWLEVLNRLSDPGTVQALERHDKRHLLLLIDFDESYPARWQIYQDKKASLPPGVADRIYLLGCRDEPEKFRAACPPRRSLERLGRDLSDDCDPPPATNLWQHDHLQHNAGELARLVAQVKPFLFSP
ncbi:hypothetical protein [Sphaerotilus sp.]|uniref:hypothetical protein n=1 Tax=Sphaerotilus sp. TaxID=2093942 RepID=UPI002ACE5B4F|nr:hypothetical protein [Sphaerotilus sp.]MDZ7858663.1 hypothetical protein [Sphaerotilus sp.]